MNNGSGVVDSMKFAGGANDVMCGGYDGSASFVDAAKVEINHLAASVEGGHSVINVEHRNSFAWTGLKAYSSALVGVDKVVGGGGVDNRCFIVGVDNCVVEGVDSVAVSLTHVNK